MDTLTSALAAADEAALTALANKGIYKRACKDIEQTELVCTRQADCAEVQLGGETVTVRVPLTESKCSCVSRTVCRHIIGAILMLRNAIPPEDAAADSVPAAEIPEVQPEAPEPPPRIPEVPAKKAAKPAAKAPDMRAAAACAEDALTLIGELLIRGLVRFSDGTPDAFDAAAVRCHALRMADAERVLRDIGVRLRDCLAHRSSFRTGDLTRRICEAVRMLEHLTSQNASPDDLGVFKQRYDDVYERLVLLPVGQRALTTGEYAGNLYYFLDSERGQFLTFSDLRPVFYEKRAQHAAPARPWGLNVPIGKMMKKQMTLQNAKCSGRQLSSSQETQLLSHTDAKLDCEAVRGLIIRDFRQIAVQCAEQDAQTEQLFFVQPERCLECRFDKHAQQMMILLEDACGNAVYVKVKYRAEVKTFVGQIETIGKRMLEHPEIRYTWLVSAYIENGELILFPIEAYDFIRPVTKPEIPLPAHFGDLSHGYYADHILTLMQRIRAQMDLTFECGLHAGASENTELTETCGQYGMEGLRGLTASFLQKAAAYRHSMAAGCRNVLSAMAELESYLAAAEQLLNTVSALYQMKGKQNHALHTE